MAVTYAQALDTATESLIDALSQTPAQQLAILVTQHASLPAHVSRALRVLAAATVQQLAPLRGVARQHAQQIADVLRRLIERGDPSQARRLMPAKAALADLALCTDARDILARLVDPPTANELLRAAVMAFERASAGQDNALCGRAAFVLGRLLHALPRWPAPHTIASAARPSKQAGQNGDFPDVKEATRLLSLLQRVYHEIHIPQPISSASQPDLLVKVALLDAAWALFARQSAVRGGKGVATAMELEKMLQASWSGGSSSTTSKTLLVNMPLLTDLATVKPLTHVLRQVLRKSSLLDILSEHTPDERLQLERLGDAWKEVGILIGEVSCARLAAIPSNSNSLDHDLLATILAILPQWEGHEAKLAEKLINAPYAQKNTDTVVQMLMDEGGEPAVTPLKQKEVDNAQSILRQRANVFDDNNSDSLQMATLLRAKGKQKAMLGAGLSDDLKATILARAEAPDSDEEGDSLGLNPFAVSDAKLEVGFEEELSDADDEEMRDAGRHLAFRRTIEDDASGEEGEADGHGGATGHGSNGRESLASNSATTAVPAASSAASERLLIVAYKDEGQAQFARQARKTEQRDALLAKLNGLGERQWDDQLVESWATMLARNPRKDRLLAAVDDVLRVGNPNRRAFASQPTGSNDDGTGEGSAARHFGPDRGRGGRIYTSAHRSDGRGSGGGRGGRARGGRGRGGTGRARGGGSGRGQGRGT